MLVVNVGNLGPSCLLRRKGVISFNASFVNVISRLLFVALRELPDSEIDQRSIARPLLHSSRAKIHCFAHENVEFH